MSHQYRAYPASEPQVEHLLRHCADARFVWNLGVERLEFGRRYARRSFAPDPTSRDLADARAVSWLAEGSSSVQQQALRDFQQALKNWRGKSHRRPRWRRAKDGQGFCVRDVKVEKLNRHWAQVQVPKHGPNRATWLRFRLSRQLPADHGMCRVTLDRAGRWHVAFAATPASTDREQTGSIVGIDRGVKNTLATSNGDMVHAPGLSEGEQAEFLRRQAEFSACKRTDPMRDVHRKAIARTYARLADRRRNWVEQTTTQLVCDHDVIVVERLNVRGMVRSAKGTEADPGVNVRAKSALNRAILAQCWGLWLRRLKEKAALCGVEVVEVPAANTSRRCNSCGHISKANRESQAKFACEKCGHEDHADTNAARNILERWPGRGQKLKVAA